MLTASVAVPILWRYGFLPDSVGVPAAVMNGVQPVSRAQEASEKAQQATEQAAPQNVEEDRDKAGAGG